VRILLLNQYYPPDTAATGQLLADVAAGLAARGHKVHVVCSAGAYGGNGGAVSGNAERAEVNGIVLHHVRASGFGRGNLPGRLMDYASFYLLALLRALWLPRMEVCLALTTPPFIGLVGVALRLLRGTRLVLWSMDLYPEVLSVLGKMPRQAPIYRVLAWVARRLYRRCAVVISLGGAMTERLVEAGAPRNRIVEVHNWVPGEKEEENPEFGGQELVEENMDSRFRANDIEDGKDSPFTLHPSPFENVRQAPSPVVPPPVVAMYSGNMGLGHELETFVRAAVLLKDVPLELAFVGGGKGRAPLEALVKELGLDTVRFQDPEPLEKLAESLSSGDIHLVSQKLDTQGLIVPSKVYGILAAGRPSVFLGPEDCEVAQILRESSAGFVMPPGDVAGTEAALRRLAGDPVLRAEMGRRAHAYYKATFGRVRSVGRIVELLEAKGGWSSTPD